jgi:environmental stress-induced protein Ves
MTIESNIIRKNVQKTTAWSGGTTTELWIFPDDADYSKLNFDCRISTAVVEVEESTFTDLSGYMRYLMILDGELALQHDDAPEIKLKPFDVDIFDGASKTVAKGKVRDFNVMLKEGYEASLQKHELTLENWTAIAYHRDFLHLVYCLNGTAQIQVEQKDKMQRHFLYEGDAFFLEGAQEEVDLLAFQMKALKGTGTVVHVMIKKLD